MNVFAPLILIVAVFACNLSERLNIEKIVQDADEIRDGEKRFFVDNGRYASLQELGIFNLVGKEVSDGRDAGFFLELKADKYHYRLSIYPDYSAGVITNEDFQQPSIFCDETGVLRSSFDPDKRADEHSSEMHPKR